MEYKVPIAGEPGAGDFDPPWTHEKYTATSEAMMVENPAFEQHLTPWRAQSTRTLAQLHDPELACIRDRSSSELKHPDRASSPQENSNGIVYEQDTRFTEMLNPQQSSQLYSSPSTLEIEPILNSTSVYSRSSASVSVLQNPDQRKPGIGNFFSNIFSKLKQISPTFDSTTNPSSALRSKWEPFSVPGQTEQPFVPTFGGQTLTFIPQRAKQQQLATTYAKAMARLQAIQQVIITLQLNVSHLTAILRAVAKIML